MAQQTAPPPADCSAGAVDPRCPPIMISGSRLRSPNLTSAQPITSISGAELLKGRLSVGDTLNDLPSLRSTYSQANSTRFLGTTGLNLLDLRGLGPERTLVLINGRRHAGGDVLGTGVSVDVSTISPDLIERVDIVTGGSSAVYGSDAIAGVVNFVLRRDFDGVRLRGQTGISRYGDAEASLLGLLAGTNFGSGRGNVTVDVEYVRRDEYFAAKRPWLARIDGFVNVDADPAATPNGSDGIPDRRFFRDIRNPAFTSTGLLRFNTGECGVDAGGAPFTCGFTFQPDGTLVPVTGSRVGTAPNGPYIGGNGDNFRLGQGLQLAPQLESLSATVLAHYVVSPAFVPFVEASYVHGRSSGTGANGPTAITGGATGDPRERPMLSNPYLSDQARQLIVQQLTLQNGVAPAANTRFAVRESFVGLPSFRDNPRRDTLRLVGGVRGDFDDGWSYEVSLDYDRFRERNRVTGNMNVQRFLLAADAGLNPATGRIQCRAQFVPSARIGFVDQGATLDNDIAACIPLNLFAATFTQQQKDYLLLDTDQTGRTSQFDATAFITGNLDFLTLPGGPVSLVAGVEYRTNSLLYRQDPRITAGYTFYNSIPALDPPKSKVKEAFGELRIPLFKDRRFLRLLEVDAAARMSDYNLGRTGTVIAYNASVQWSPARDLRLRGDYARAVRAPNQGELYTAPSQNFALSFVDPCSTRNLGAGSPNRSANCATAGRPAFTYAMPPYGPGGYDLTYGGPLEIVTGGNPELRAERSNSLTVGGVITPAIVPGLSLSADYYSIVVRNVITTPTAQAIVNRCYDAPTLDNAFCGLFQRNPTPDTVIPNPADPSRAQIVGNGPNGEYFFQILEGSLRQTGLNFARLTARGLDFEVAYRGRLTSVGVLDTRLRWSHLLERSQNLDLGDPAFKDVLLMELGNPRDSLTWDSSIKRGPATVGYRLRYVSKMVVNQYEDLFSAQGRPPQNADYSDPLFYPRQFIHDVRASLDVGERLNVYGGIENLTDNRPPLGLTGITDGGGIYDNRGRFFYIGAVARF